MRSTYYRAESEDGDGCDDPSEDVLFMMIKRLNTTDNTFVIVQPDVEDPGWFASIGVLDEGGFEVEFRDTAFREHELTTQSDVNKIARDVTIWLAARATPGKPIRLNYNI